eukprot:TRINITY_DN958_c2_g1_i1.p1 TRINITY_DN958_c2_g1~~TRINITY_DN958_c2_g1_i1.p1  ORF type:complete len:173 (+),score=42.30 TRINITY_DN958_c2_g1_i1:306-824(+)
MFLSDSTWKDCGGTGGTIESFSIPDPVVIGPPLPIQFHATLKEAIVSGLIANVSVTIHRTVFGEPIKIPCVQNIGSCTYPLDVCTKMPVPGSKQCDQLKKLGVPCECPVNPMVIQSPAGGLSVNTTAIEKVSWLAKGHYQVQAQVFTKTNSLFACFEVEATLTEASSFAEVE